MDMPTATPLVKEPPIAELVRDVRAGMGQSLAASETLPPTAYTSQHFFDLEVDRIFKREWMAVGHVAELPKVGDYFTIDLMGEMLVVVRGPDRIRVMSRICLHRWAPVVDGAGHASAFSCPFHKWSYALDGRLLGAPHMEQAQGFDRKGCRLPELRSEIVMGTIFVTFDAATPSIAGRLGELEERFAVYDMANLAIGYSVDYVCRFNWKIAVETFMECYHHIGAHATTAEPFSPGALSWGEDGREAWTAVHGPLAPHLPTEENLKSGLPVFEGISEEAKRDVALYVVYPTLLITVFADRIHWTTLIPEGPEHTLWHRHVLVRPEALSQPDFEAIITKLRAASGAISDEDLAVNELQQRGAASMFARAGRLSHLEKAVWQLADYVRDRVQD